ncbi:hypothetical protein Daus18300_005173 [Diaporthe australafricana]|uniref:Uncharacterized protein n=1 Tax=Diaporthe australafricana TaxID=127596 RepID=A0ABR3X3U2_9PEZI
MSLTSIGGGYNQAPLRMRGNATIPKKPIFYDYSEDFEDVIEPPPVVPVAPIPRRVSTLYRPAAIQDDSGTSPGSTDEAQNEFVAYLQGSTATDHVRDQGMAPTDDQDRPISLLHNVAGVVSQKPQESQSDSRPSTETAVPAVDLGALMPPIPDERKESEETSAMKDMDQTKEFTVVEMTSDVSTLEDPPEPKTPAFNANVHFHEVVRCNDEADSGLVSYEAQTVQDVAPAQRLDKLSHLSRSASTKLPRPHLNDDSSTMPKTPGPEDPEVVSGESHKDFRGPNEVIAATTSARDRPSPSEDEDRNFEQFANVVPHPPRVSSLRENRRQPAALRVNTAVDEPHQYQVVSTRSGPTLTPQPISPAKLLRVKNSIPQLMKALPPLPGYAPAPESPFGPAVVPMEFEPFEISQLTDARSTLIDAFPAEEAPRGYDAFIFDRNGHKPRLKLKHAASFAPEHERSSKGEHTGPKSTFRPDASLKRPATATATVTAVATEYSTAPVKRRLPIKVSRPTLTSLVPDDAGTVKRRPGIQKSSTVSEITSREPIDLFSPAVALRVAVANNNVSSTQQTSLHSRVRAGTPIVKVTPVARIQQIPGGDDTRGTSLDAHMDMLRIPSADSQPSGECEMQSFFSENSIVKPRQGLRKRFSNLKSKLAEPLNHHRPPLSKLPRDDRRDGAGTLLVPEGQLTGTYKEQPIPVSNSKPHQQAIATRKVRSKLEKFMKGAKHKLRSWGRGKRRTG